jgi:hypothetical protein
VIIERGKRVLEPNKTTAKIAWASSVYSLYMVRTLEELLQVFMKLHLRRIIYHTRGRILSKSKPCLF